MTDRISRRSALVVLSAPVVLTAPAVAQAPPPMSPDQKLEKSYADIKDTSNRLTQISIPVDLEPAFTFHV